MTDDLRRQLEAEAGSASAPPVAEVWRAGRRRRSTRRALAAGGAVAVVLLVAGVAVRAIGNDDSTQTVRAGAVPETCEPGPVLATETAGRAIEPLLRPPEPPRTPAAMVHGGGTEDLQVPDAVARVRVLSTDDVRRPNERLLVPEPEPEHRAWVEVTDPVFGAEVGDRFSVTDAGPAYREAELRKAKRIVEQQIDDFQRSIDRIDLPLAELDQQIVNMDPNDPRYGPLIEQRGRIKDQTDAERNEAQTQLSEYQRRLQRLQITERLGDDLATTTSCYRFRAGDELVVALVRPGGEGPYELTGSSSFFLIDGDGFSDDLDAARLAVPGWSDSELLRLARESTPDQFLDRLRQAAD